MVGIVCQSALLYCFYFIILCTMEGDRKGDEIDEGTISTMVKMNVIIHSLLSSFLLPHGIYFMFVLTSTCR